MNYEEIIDSHNELREKCLKLVKRNKSLLGEYAWPQAAIHESDISLEYTENGISCYGVTFTSQTSCSEWFEFMISFERLKEKNA